MNYGTDIEKISGRVENLKQIATRTGRTMVVFSIGRKPFKAFGDLADALAALENEQINVTAQRGQYKGALEYAVRTVNATVDGTAVDMADTRSVPPRGCPTSKTTHSAGIINPRLQMNDDSIEREMREALEAGSRLAGGKVTPFDAAPGPAHQQTVKDLAPGATYDPPWHSVVHCQDCTVCQYRHAFRASISREENKEVEAVQGVELKEDGGPDAPNRCSGVSLEDLKDWYAKRLAIVRNRKAVRVRAPAEKEARDAKDNDAQETAAVVERDVH